MGAEADRHIVEKGNNSDSCSSSGFLNCSSSGWMEAQCRIDCPARSPPPRFCREKKRRWQGWSTQEPCRLHHRRGGWARFFLDTLLLRFHSRCHCHCHCRRRRRSRLAPCCTCNCERIRGHSVYQEVRMHLYIRNVETSVVCEGKRTLNHKSSFQLPASVLSICLSPMAESMMCGAAGCFNTARTHGLSRYAFSLVDCGPGSRGPPGDSSRSGNSRLPRSH